MDNKNINVETLISKVHRVQYIGIHISMASYIIMYRHWHTDMSRILSSNRINDSRMLFFKAYIINDVHVYPTFIPTLMA